MLKEMFLQVSQKAFKIKNLDFLIADLFIFSLTPFLALYTRLDSWQLALEFEQGLLLSMSIFIVVKLLCTNVFGCYRRYWRFATTEDLLQIAAACATICFLESLIISIFHFRLQSDIYVLPRSFPIMDGLLTFIGIGAARFSVKIFERMRSQRLAFTHSSRERVVIYGAGRAGIALVDAVQQRSNPAFCPVAFIDDDPKKRDCKIRGLPVLGGRQQLLGAVDRLKAVRVVIAMPSVSGQVIREIVRLCGEHGILTSTLPSIHEIINGRVTLKSLRNVKIEDLLRRDTIHSDLGQTSIAVQGKRILITGAGGSIGSEVCRQVLQCEPAELILMGHGENSVFLIQQELSQTLLELQRAGQEQSTQLTMLIADLKDSARLNYAFERYRPEVVFHAAAHKHVPLMEINPSEAITNNVMGTQNLVDTVLAYGVERFVMISTDKAVNPSSIMGASKRLGELIVLRAAQHFQKQFCVVRFGNVLGSRGSVVPIFRDQIERGGPVTITHPEVTRYFMTIPEAVHLVLQAMVISQGGEIFMLNMGRPVKIVDLAQDLIRLSGYQVGSEIQIVYTGLRPGEKLHEELLLPDEAYEPTANENLLVVRNAYEQVPLHLEEGIQPLIAAALESDEALIRVLLKELIPSFKTESSFSLVSKGLRSSKYTLDAVLEAELQGANSFFPSNPASNVLGRFNVEKELAEADVSRDFRVLYQPVLLLQKDYLVEGFEALLHWQHQRLGLIRSSQFIEMANQTQCIHEMGLWGVEEVCSQLCRFEALSPHSRFTVSINLSCAQLLHPNLIPRLSQVFQETQVNMTRLCFEIPENFIIRYEEHAIAVLLKLKGLGARLLLDNFGGTPLQHHSPLTRWVHLFNGVKIDRSRVQNLTRNMDGLRFFRETLDMSRQWGLDLIATGIESTQQLAQLKTLQCQYGQGYYFLRPVERDQAHVLLQGQSLN
jgi:FlaA1/EpsC-like NDP-sugar epimerase/EAL domain-containing protein (putative c-di-GMP-specific phosphodiesterase class I)